MTLEIKAHDDDFTFEDAIAYEFFMEHIDIAFDTLKDSDEILKAVQDVAKASYLIAQVFSAERNEFKTKTIEVTDGKS
jgi:hypothetical protein